MIITAIEDDDLENNDRLYLKRYSNSKASKVVKQVQQEKVALNDNIMLSNEAKEFYSNTILVNLYKTYANFYYEIFLKDLF